MPWSKYGWYWLSHSYLSNLQSRKTKQRTINVYGATVSPKLEKVNIFPYYISNQPPEKTRNNLLLLTKDVEDTSCEGKIDETHDPEQDYEIDETYDPDAFCEEGEIDETYDPHAEDPEQNKSIKETKYHYSLIKNLSRLLWPKQTQRKNILLRPLPLWLHERRLTH